MTIRGLQDTVRCLSVGIAFTLAGGAAAAQDGWNLDLPTEPEKVAPTVSTKTTLEAVSASIELPGIAASLENAGDGLYHRLAIEGAGTLDEEGKPDLPFLTYYLAIPLDAKSGEPAAWEVKVAVTDEETFEQVQPMPAQPAPWLGEEARPEFVLDEQVYGSSEAFPGELYETAAFQVGNLHLLELRVFPAQAYPAKQRLSLATKIDVSVSFSSDSGLVEPQIVGDLTGNGATGEEWLLEFTLNPEMIQVVDHQWIGPLALDSFFKTVCDEPFELLIITRSELYGPALDLAQWRHDTGTPTCLATLSEKEYTTAEDVLDYVELMDELNVVPGTDLRAMSAVLLIGDVEIVPAALGLNTRGQADPTGSDPNVMVVGTDHFYGCTRGDDERTDLAVGRISVDDKTEAQVVVDKILAYEGRPASEHPDHLAAYSYFHDDILTHVTLDGTATFENGVVSVVGDGTDFAGNIFFDDHIRAAAPATGTPAQWAPVDRVIHDDLLYLTTPYGDVTSSGHTLEVGAYDGRDNWEFVKGAERTRQFMKDKGTTTRFGYVRTDGPAPTRLHDGSYLDGELMGYAWDADATEIADNWREGLDGIVVHVGHGERTALQTPWFAATDLPLMDSPTTAHYPLLLNFNCSSGWFDNETDVQRTAAGTLVAHTDTTAASESFCESALRMQDGGSIASICSIRGSDADYNDDLLTGVFQAFYPEYPDWEGAPITEDRVYAGLGTALRAAEFHLLASVGDNARAQYHLQSYHLLGDPMMVVRLP